MKKTIILILLHILNIVCFAQRSQKWVKVEYTKQLKENALPKSLSEDEKKFIGTIHAVLISGSQYSYYQELGELTFVAHKPSQKKIEKTNIELKEIDRLSSTHIHAGHLERNMSDVYKSFTDQLMVSILRLSGNILRIERALPDYAWEISNEVASIAGMSCKKAFTTTSNGNIREAWFTDDIPVANGPDVFHGLPGLILKIETAQYTIEATKISFIDPVPIKKPTMGELVAPEEIRNRIFGVIQGNKEQTIRNGIINQPSLIKN
jgi:GLPGLI family protein